IPVLLMVVYTFQKNETKFDRPAKIGQVARLIFKRKSLKSIFYISFLLQFFYSWMVIYTPLYLRSLDFSWELIGQIFTVMLLPFVFFQFPVGYLADRYFGEKEMLTLGLVIMSLATVGLFFISTPLAIGAVLFLTRVGASTVEILRDSYFYKQINAAEIDLIDYFRNTGPLAYIISPLIATGLLLFLPMSALFIILGLFCLTGLIFSLTMPDTK
ncbi:MAG TPA: MFS transporter, partial [Patescibacteria group bacterium]